MLEQRRQVDALRASLEGNQAAPEPDRLVDGFRRAIR